MLLNRYDPILKIVPLITRHQLLWSFFTLVLSQLLQLLQNTLVFVLISVRALCHIVKCFQHIKINIKPSFMTSVVHCLLCYCFPGFEILANFLEFFVLHSKFFYSNIVGESGLISLLLLLPRYLLRNLLVCPSRVEHLITLSRNPGKTYQCLKFDTFNTTRILFFCVICLVLLLHDYYIKQYYNAPTACPRN